MALAYTGTASVCICKINSVLHLHHLMIIYASLSPSLQETQICSYETRSKVGVSTWRGEIICISRTVCTNLNSKYYAQLGLKLKIWKIFNVKPLTLRQIWLIYMQIAISTLQSDLGNQEKIYQSASDVAAHLILNFSVS